MRISGLALGCGAVVMALYGTASGCGGSIAPLSNDDGGTLDSSSGSGSGSSSGGSNSSSGSSSGGSSSSSGSSSGGSSSSSGSSSGGSNSSSGSSSGGSNSSSGSSSGGSSGSSGSSSGGSSSSSGSSSGGSSSSSGSSSGGSSSSSGSSSGGSSGSSSGGSTGGTGEIDFDQCTGGATICGTDAFQFYASFTQGSPAGCTPTVTSGTCAFYPSCTTTQTGVSAGTLTLTGGSLGAGVMVTPDASNEDEYDYEATNPMFSGGQTLTVVATGATVPAFGPESVVAPAAAVLTAPVATSGAYTIPTTADLTVTWTGGQSGAQFIVEGASSTNAYFQCTWDASLGQATVPQSILAGLAGQSMSYFVYGQYTTTTFTVGGYSISELALPYSGGTATFQ